MKCVTCCISAIILRRTTMTQNLEINPPHTPLDSVQAHCKFRECAPVFCPLNAALSGLGWAVLLWRREEKKTEEAGAGAGAA